MTRRCRANLSAVRLQGQAGDKTWVPIRPETPAAEPPAGKGGEILEPDRKWKEEVLGLCGQACRKINYWRPAPPSSAPDDILGSFVRHQDCRAQQAVGGWGGGGDMPADGEVREVKFPHVNVRNNCISELFLPIFQVFNLISMFYLLIWVRQSRDEEMRSLPLWRRTPRHKVLPVQLPHQETFCHTGSRTVIECDILV